MPWRLMMKTEPKTDQARRFSGHTGIQPTLCGPSHMQAGLLTREGPFRRLVCASSCLSSDVSSPSHTHRPSPVTVSTPPLLASAPRLSLPLLAQFPSPPWTREPTPKLTVPNR